MDKHLDPIMRKMCSVVGVDYEAIDFHEDDWFLRHEWSEEEEVAFIKWIEDYLSANKESFTYLTGLTRFNKRLIRKLAKEIVFMYGWRTRLETKTNNDEERTI